MGILINKNTKILVQGITGSEGSKATKEMLDYGSNIVCGVTPGKGGEYIEGVPVFDTVKEAVNVTEVNASVIYVPPLAAKDACIEAIQNGIKLIICITENIPIHDTSQILEYARRYNATLIGPSSVGIINPNERCKIGSIGGSINRSYMGGPVGLISKSGGMCSETALLLKLNGIGVSTALGIGGDTISGSDFCDIIELFEKDDETKVIVIYGEIGGEYEQKVASMYKEGKFKKPLIAFIAGKFAENIPQVTLGHAGAIIEGNSTSRSFKVEVLLDAKIKVAQVHHEILDLVKEELKK